VQSIDTVKRGLDEGDGRCPAAGESRNILDEYQSRKKALGEPKERDQKTGSRVGEPCPSVLAPLCGLRERLTRRSSSQHSQLTETDSQLSRRQSLGNFSDIPRWEQVPLGPIRFDTCTRVLINLDACNGSKAGLLEAEVQTAQPSEGREDGWARTVRFGHLV
jgi:hypothetical protein